MALYLIAFNDEHCDEELRYFGQELFHVADETTGLDDHVAMVLSAVFVPVGGNKGPD